VESTKNDQRKAKHGRNTAEEAALTQSFGIFAESVTRKDVRNEAKAAVVEAPAKSVLPVSHLENGLID